MAGKQRRYTEAEIARAVEVVRLCGGNRKEAHRRLQAECPERAPSRPTIERYADLHGIPVYRKMPVAKQKTRALDLMAKGATSAEAAAEVGVHRETAQRWATQARLRRLLQIKHPKVRRRAERLARMQARLEVNPKASARMLAAELGVSYQTVLVDAQHLGVRLFTPVPKRNTRLPLVRTLIELRIGEAPRRRSWPEVVRRLHAETGRSMTPENARYIVKTHAHRLGYDADVLLARTAPTLSLAA